VSSVALRQYAALSKRSIVNMLRRPTAIIPASLFPLLFLALTASALGRAINLPGFPETDSFLQFAIATTAVQGAMFGSIDAGAALATDIEGGFFDRILAAPVARTSMLVGRVMGAATIGFIQGLFFFAVGTIFGLQVAGGIGAVLAVAGVVALVSSGAGSIFMALALRTGSAEAVQGSFPLLFTFFFFSSAFFPRNLMSGWFENVATINPLSHMIEGLRSLVISGFDVGDLLVSLSIAGGIFVTGISLASIALARRLARTG
jgi:ABC-2 type transport system permease protein